MNFSRCVEGDDDYQKYLKHSKSYLKTNHLLHKRKQNQTLNENPKNDDDDDDDESSELLLQTSKSRPEVASKTHLLKSVESASLLALIACILGATSCSCLGHDSGQSSSPAWQLLRPYGRPKPQPLPPALPAALPPRKPVDRLELGDQLAESALNTGHWCGQRSMQMSMRRKQPATTGDFPSSSSLLYIVGGNEVYEDDIWPWSIAIYELDPLNGQREFICSGSLISEHYVLTAAHCIQQSRFDTLNADEVYLKIASVRLDDKLAPFYSVSRVFVHPDYVVGRKLNDIALLRLDENQRLPVRARPICLPSRQATKMDFTDHQVTIIGWGKTSAVTGDESVSRLIGANSNPFAPEAAGQPSALAVSSDAQEPSQTKESLLQAELRVANTQQCNRNYSKLEIDWLNIDEHFLCARDPLGRRDACQGDSGGPMMWHERSRPSASAEEQSSHKWYQLGLVSFGHGCANSQYPGVYTSISYYMPWILNTVSHAEATSGAPKRRQNEPSGVD